jgi:hypothetical protein
MNEGKQRNHPKDKNEMGNWYVSMIYGARNEWSRIKR